MTDSEELGSPSGVKELNRLGLFREVIPEVTFRTWDPSTHTDIPPLSCTDAVHIP